LRNNNGHHDPSVGTGAPPGERSLFVAVPHSEISFSIQVPHEFVDQVEMYAKLIGISPSRFVRFAVYELVHSYRGGALKQLADGE
jgi:hypothetical protein